MSAEENPESFGSKWKYWTKDQGWKEDPKLSIAGEKLKAIDRVLG